MQDWCARTLPGSVGAPATAAAGAGDVNGAVRRSTPAWSLASTAQQVPTSRASAAVGKAVLSGDDQAGDGDGAVDGAVAGDGVVNCSAVSGRVLGGRMGRTGDRCGASALEAGDFCRGSDDKAGNHEDKVFGSSKTELHMVLGNGLRRGSNGEAGASTGLDVVGSSVCIGAALDDLHGSGHVHVADVAAASPEHAGAGAVKASATAGNQESADAEKDIIKVFLAGLQ